MAGPEGEAAFAPRSEETSCKRSSPVSRQQPPAVIFLAARSSAGTGGFLPTAEPQCNSCGTQLATKAVCACQPRAVSGCPQVPTPPHPVSWLVAQPLASSATQSQVSKGKRPSCCLSDVNVPTWAPLPGKGGRPDHSSRGQGRPELWPRTQQSMVPRH